MGFTYCEFIFTHFRICAKLSAVAGVSTAKIVDIKIFKSSDYHVIEIVWKKMKSVQESIECHRAIKLPKSIYMQLSIGKI